MTDAYGEIVIVRAGGTPAVRTPAHRRLGKIGERVELIPAENALEGRAQFSGIGFHAHSLPGQFFRAAPKQTTL